MRIAPSKLNVSRLSTSHIGRRSCTLLALPFGVIGAELGLESSMAIFEKFLRTRPKPTALVAEHEAFFTVLAAAALCDRKLAPEESEELHAICHRLKMFVSLSNAEVDSMVYQVFEKLAQDFEGAVTTAIRSIKEEEMRRAVYANALDIVFADRIVNEHEKLFLDDLETNLKIDPAFMERAAEVIGIKNRY
jgi:hypothetical protein